MHARAEVGHQVAERSGLPALVERLEALGDAVGRRRDLVGVDRVELLRRESWDPRRSAPSLLYGGPGTARLPKRTFAGLGGGASPLTPSGLDRVHEARDASIVSLAGGSTDGVSIASAAASVVSEPPRSLVVRRPCGLSDTVLDPVARLRLAQVPEHHRPREDRPDRIGSSLPGMLGRRTMHRFEKPPPRLSGLMFAEGAWPRPPTSSEARSLRMSPNMLDVTITSKSAGRRTSCMAATSTIEVLRLRCRRRARAPLEDALPEVVRMVHARCSCRPS